MRLLFQLKVPKFLEMHNSDIYRTVWIFIGQLGIVKAKLYVMYALFQKTCGV